MTPEQADRLGRLADGLDNVLYATQLPVPAQVHVGALQSKIRETRDEIVALVREVTGQDPWETNPLQG